MFRNEKDLQNYRNGIVQWCKDFEPDYFVTLTFAYSSVTENFAHKSLDNYLRMVSRQVYRKRSKDKLQRLVFKEKNYSDGIHYHLLVKQPETKSPEELKQIMKDKWIKTHGHGYAGFKNDEWFKPVGNLEELAGYVTKTIKPNNDDFLVSDLISL
jgi:hypothetical protein